MLNYRHLYYFWVASKEGGIARAAERLDMAVQTVSTQIRELERALGHALFKPSGRSVELTTAGVAARRLADQIFQLGEQLPVAVREAADAQGVRLSVGSRPSIRRACTCTATTGSSTTCWPIWRCTVWTSCWPTGRHR